jgi:uncharacterized repeat protein (TIGR02543 family)
MKNIALIIATIFLLVSCKKEETPPPVTATKYSVTYLGNGNTSGAIPVDGNSYDSGASATALSNDGSLVKTGFSFVGWNTAADGSGTDYIPGSAIAIGSSNVVLYAKWWDNAIGTLYKVTYYGNGNTSGSVPVDNTFYVPGAQITVKDNTGGLDKNGGTFKNWNTSQFGGGTSYSAGDKITIQSNILLYATYNAGGTGKYFGFNASGQVKSKSALTSSWSSEDLSNTFGSSNVVTVVWNGSQYVGFNASGQTKTKSSVSSSWSSQDLNNTFGSSNIVAAVWNGSQYVGFNASGQVKTKSSLTSSWSSQDLNNTFGSSNVVCVVWNGSQYVGFNASGQVKTKSSLTSSWSSQDLNNTFGSSNIVAAAWNGSQYVGFNASGQVKTKSSLTSSWSSQDLNNTFGSSNVVCAVYN